MTGIDINGSDSGTVHVFQLDLPEEAVERFSTMAGTGEWPLKYAMGAEKLKPGPVDVVRIADLGDMPLTHYLTEAHNVAAEDLKSDKTRLDTLTGHVVILPPQAFDNTSQTLTISPPLIHIGSYGAARPAPRGPALRSEAAHGAPTGGAPAESGRGGSLMLKLLVIGIGIVILLTLAMILR